MDLVDRELYASSAEYRKGRSDGFAEAALLLMQPGDYSGGCGNKECVCRKPQYPCAEWMGTDGGLYCPRCGWARSRHPDIATGPGTGPGA